jgi:hypothetical protein
MPILSLHERARSDRVGQESNFDHKIRTAVTNAAVLKLRGRSQQVLHHIEEQSIDFIYVDGSHSALDVMEDAAAAWGARTWLRNRFSLVRIEPYARSSAARCQQPYPVSSNLRPSPAGRNAC